MQLTLPVPLGVIDLMRDSEYPPGTWLTWALTPPSWEGDRKGNTFVVRDKGFTGSIMTPMHKIHHTDLRFQPNSDLL